METLNQGVRILISATDDEVTLLGPDVKERDALIVYPKGKESAGPSGKADLTAYQLGAPMRSNTFFASCGLADDANADVCVAVKKGRRLRQSRQ